MLLILSLVAAITGNVQAQARGEQSKFEVLAQHFDGANVPAMNEIMGWYSGRCAEAKAPTILRPGVLFAEIRKAVADQGPLFEPTVSKIWAFNVSDQAAAEIYDHPKPEVLKSLGEFFDVKFADRNVSEVVASASGLSTTYNWQDEPAGRFDTRIETSTGLIYVRHVSFRPDTVTMYCYFFKKIKNTDY